MEKPFPVRSIRPLRRLDGAIVPAATGAAALLAVAFAVGARSAAAPASLPSPRPGWAHAYGGPGDDEANALALTSDGGFVVAGRTASFSEGEGDLWVVRLDASGGIVWQERLGPGVGQSVRQTVDGGFLVAGSVASPAAGHDEIRVVRLDGAGRLLWEKSYGGAGNADAYSIRETSDGGSLVAGRLDTVGPDGIDAWVLKLDPAGGVIWQRTYGGKDYDEADAAQPTADGGFIVAGRTDSFGAGYPLAWVFRLDASGQFLWQRSYGVNGSGEANALEETKDGGYVVAGSTASFGRGNDDAWVFKLDRAGNVVWQKTYGGPGYDYADAVHPTRDGGFVVAGWTTSFGAGGTDIWVLRLDARGEIAWQKTFGGRGGDQANSVQEAAGGGFALAGTTESFGAGLNDVWLLALPPDGAIRFRPECGARATTTRVVPQSGRLSVGATRGKATETDSAPVPSTWAAAFTTAVVSDQAP